MYKTVFCMLFILFFWASVTVLQAPEITEYDIYRYDTYRVAENGSILDRDGVVRGWIHGNTVYDTQWNIKHQIRGN